MISGVWGLRVAWKTLWSQFDPAAGQALRRLKDGLRATLGRGAEPGRAEDQLVQTLPGEGRRGSHFWRLQAQQVFPVYEFRPRALGHDFNVREQTGL